MLTEKLSIKEKENAESIGLNGMLQQLAEEGAEVAKASLKCLRARGIGQKTEVTEDMAKKKLVEEMVDVQICLDHIRYLLDIPDEDFNTLRNAAVNKVKNRYTNV